MPYVIVNSKTSNGLGSFKTYATERGAKIAATRMFGNYPTKVMEYSDWAAWRNLNKNKIKVRSLMTGTEVEIDEDTPLCCDPSSETFWMS